MTHFFDKIKQIFAKNEMDESMMQPPERNNPGTSSGEETRLTEESIIGLMQRLEATQEDAYSCEEAYALFEEYVELVASNEEAALLMPLVKNHVDICPDCTEHLNILLNILKSEADPTDAPEL